LFGRNNSLPKIAMTSLYILFWCNRWQCSLKFSSLNKKFKQQHHSKEIHNQTRGPMGLYCSPGFCHVCSFIKLWPKDVTCQTFMHLLGPQKGPPLYESQALFPTKFGWNWPSGSWKALPYILLCQSLSPWGAAIHDPREFIWTHLNLLAARMLHAKYQCIPASGSWDDFWRFIKIFLILPLIRP